MAASGYDDSVETAWGRFAVALDQHLRQMRVGDALVLESHYDGRTDGESPASIRLCALAGGSFRCEVPPNQRLHPLRALSPADLVRLTTMGFGARDGSDGYCLDVGPAELARLTLAPLIVLREIWALPHPSFLRAQTSGRPDVEEFDAFTPEIDDDAPESSLQILVEAAVEEMFGGPVDVDAEGIITLGYKDSDVHLRVLGEDRYIEVYAGILDVASLDCVEEYDITREVLDAIPTLNREWPAVKWHLEDTALLGLIRIDGAPFMAAHLARALEAMGDLLDSAGDILTELTMDAEAAGHPGGAALLGYTRPTGAKTLLEPFPDPEPAPGPAAADTIVAVLRLNSGATRHLGDVEVADLCEGDVELVLECLRIAKAQLSLWTGDAPGAAAGDSALENSAAEQEGWGLVIDKLLGAIAVLSQPGS